MHLFKFRPLLLLYYLNFPKPLLHWSICSADNTTYWGGLGNTAAGGGGGGVLFDNSGPNADDGTRPGGAGFYAGRGGVGYGAGGGGGGLYAINGIPTRWDGGYGAPGFVYVEWG